MSWPFARLFRRKPVPTTKVVATTAPGRRANIAELVGAVPVDREVFAPIGWNGVHEHKRPRPFPGVVPSEVDERTLLAMDWSPADITRFGEVQGAWDGFSFMGYALLSELGQITEFRRPATILADDMTRKWVKLVSVSNADKTEEIKALDAETKRFSIQDLFRRAFEMDNQYGIGHLFIDLGKYEGPELATPLLSDVKIAKGSLKGFRTVEPIWTYPVEYDARNPLSPDFYRPINWYVNGQKVHSSRLLSFCSRPVPDLLKPAYQFGGLSLTQLMKPYVENWLRTRQAISDITSNFSTPVLQTDMDLTTNKGGAALLAERAAVYNTMRDNQGLLVADKNKEDFKIVAAPLSGLSELQAQAEEQMAFPAGVPLVKLFGITPSGLNASSDGEVRVYYDSIASTQERVGSPNLQRVIEILQMNLWGKIDPDLGFVWQPLWAMTEKEKAEIRKIDADTDAVYSEMGSIDAMEVRKTIASEEDSRYSSIDIDKVPEQPDDETGEGSPDLSTIVGQLGARDPREDRGRDPREESRNIDPSGDDPRTDRARASLKRPASGRALERAERGARE